MTALWALAGELCETSQMSFISRSQAKWPGESGGLGERALPRGGRQPIAKLN